MGCAIMITLPGALIHVFSNDFVKIDSVNKVSDR